jgi:hypothetical protein
MDRRDNPLVFGGIRADFDHELLVRQQSRGIESEPIAPAWA